jgi:hypothetical protein
MKGNSKGPVDAKTVALKIEAAPSLVRNHPTWCDSPDKPRKPDDFFYYSIFQQTTDGQYFWQSFHGYTDNVN